jgi:hypothetical protein
MATVTFRDWWLISFTCILNRAGLPVEFLRVQSPLGVDDSEQGRVGILPRTSDGRDALPRDPALQARFKRRKARTEVTVFTE